MFKFSNLIGPVYSQGNLEFSSDGFEVYTPVRNRISKFGLKNTLSHKTLSIEATRDFTCMSLSPNGLVLIAANDIGEVYVISTKTHGVLHFMHVPGSVRIVRYSPDGKLFAVATKDSILVYAAPCATLQFNPCEMRQSYAVKDAVDLEWSDDSVLLAATSTEGTVDIHPLKKYWNFRPFVVTGNSNGTLRSFFLENSYDFYTVAKDGSLKMYECSVTADMLLLNETDKTEMKHEGPNNGPENLTRAKYNRKDVHYYKDLFPKKEKRPPMTSAVYNKSRRILVTCFGSVVFLHELPDFVLLANLQISCPISAVTINSSAEWVAFGSQVNGQLVVYEWQSQHFIMDQKSHYDAVECFTFSTDGELIASGGIDGKIKVWNSTNAKLLLTFSDHTAPITGIVFSPRNNAFFSCSEDGTARAFDITRARTFRVFVPPSVAQLSCLSVDPKGELIVAGSKDNFSMYLWSIKTGQFLMTLTGHTGPVTSVAFSPAAGSATVVSASMDKTARLWDTIEMSGESESILLAAEGICVAWKPNGESFCVATTNGELSFFNRDGSPSGETEGGRHFMIPAPPKASKKEAERLQSTHYFKSISYSPCGKLLAAASTTKTVCFYNVDHQRIVATQYVTNNKSFEGVETFTHPKSVGDFGALQAGEYSDQLSMPGTRKGDMAARTYYNQIRINGISFSPTGGRWIAATNEGLLVFSSEVADTFDPIGADVQVTPDNIKMALHYKEYDVALAMSLRLNMDEHLRETTSTIPFENITLTVASLPQKYIVLLIRFLNEEILKTKRVGFYLRWIEVVLKRISSSFPGLLTSDPEIEPSLVKLRQRMESVQNYVTSFVGRNSEMVQAILQRSTVNRMSLALEEMKSERMEEE